jgi:tRNA(Ile)-lysidine synthase
VAELRDDAAAEAAARLPLAGGDRVGVAVSGGPDSVAALVLVARSCAPRSVPVTALHVEHGLRPGSAAAERAIVEQAARAVGAAVAVRAVDVAGARAAGGGSTEFVARTLRHAALDAMARELGLTHVVLAHHRDDQVETVLLSILRGAWPGALAGIPATRRLPCGARLVRPFLAVPRDVLRRHAAGFATADDAMNRDRAHRRVAVRDLLLPSLRAADDAVEDAVLAVASAAGAVDSAAIVAAAAIARAPGFHAEPGALVAPAAVLAGAGRFARSRFLRAAADEDPSFGAPTWGLFLTFERALASGGPCTLDLRRTVRLTVRDGIVALFSTAPSAPAESALSWEGLPGSLPVGPVRRVRVEPLGSGPAPPAAADARSALVHLRHGAAVLARPRAPRDRFRLGPQGTKLVADELSDRKVQPVWRGRIPLVFVDGELRWMPGLRAVKTPDEPPPNAKLVLEGPAPWIAT